MLAAVIYNIIEKYASQVSRWRFMQGIFAFPIKKNLPLPPKENVIWRHCNQFCRGYITTSERFGYQVRILVNLLQLSEPFFFKYGIKYELFHFFNYFVSTLIIKTVNKHWLTTVTSRLITASVGVKVDVSTVFFRTNYKIQVSSHWMQMFWLSADY